MRVFLDTNVLVAAFATRGLCADVLRYVLAQHQLVTGEVVLRELRRALTRRIKLPSQTVDEILTLLREQEVVGRPAKPADVNLRDPDDAWVVASAVAGHAEVLVTGDRDLLDAADELPVRVLDPRAFWESCHRRG